MAVSSYPFDGQPTTETQFSYLFRELQDSGVAVSADGLGFKVSADASGMNVKVQPGFAIVRGHAVQSTAVETLTIAASGATTRIDRIVLRLNPATNSITLTVLLGTASAPALTETDTGIFDIPLATVTVDANVTNIAAAKVTDERRFTGTRVTCWSTASRPVAPRKGQLGLNTTTGLWEHWTGTAWADLLDWAKITGKPGTFPPDPHSHPWTTGVTGKPATFPPDPHSHSSFGAITVDSAIGNNGGFTARRASDGVSAAILPGGELVLDNRTSDPAAYQNSVVLYCKGASLFARYPDGSIQKIGGPY